MPRRGTPYPAEFRQQMVELARVGRTEDQGFEPLDNDGQLD